MKSDKNKLKSLIYFKKFNKMIKLYHFLKAEIKLRLKKLKN